MSDSVETKEAMRWPQVCNALNRHNTAKNVQKQILVQKAKK